MEERLGEMKNGRRERMRKGAIVSSSPQGITRRRPKEGYCPLKLSCFRTVLATLNPHL